MGPFPIVLLITMVANVLIGILVLFANPTRVQSQMFAFFASVLAAWTACYVPIAITSDAFTAEVFIRIASYLGTLMPIAFHGFCYAIVHDGLRTRKVFSRIRPHILLSQFFGILCFTDLYIKGVQMVAPDGGGAPRPVTVSGFGYALVNIYIMAGMLGLAINYGRAMGRLEGIRRAEMQFVLLGNSLSVLVGIILILILPALAPDMATQRFGPLGLIPMTLTIAYGIATRRLMNVTMLLQRCAAYALLALYLCALYTVVISVTAFLLAPRYGETVFLPHLLAALVVAFSMAPVHGLFQRFSQKLFINVPVTNVRKAARMGSEVFAAISTTDGMILRFRDVVDQSGIDAEFVHVFLKNTGGFTLHAPDQDTTGGASQISESSTLVQVLARTKSPVAADVLKRVRPTEESLGAAANLAHLGASVAAGVFSQKTLSAIVTMGQRRSGLIYTAVEQDALQILCNQLGVALENARLYTEVRNNQIYNDTLVDNLITGLVAVDADGRVTVLNREAQRVTGLNPEQVLGEEVGTLPSVLANALNRTLASGEGVRNIEAVIRDPRAANGVLDEDEEKETPISLGTSLFRSAHGVTMGAFLVFSDLTILKKLEQQVRRSDRLASIGTLSAGMAHEIKNPLVTIKTFTELLPERYKDEDFRDTFSALVGQEVGRIDRIVNEVLHFARPAKPDLKPTSLRELLAGSLRLLQERMKQKGIRLETNYSAEADTIRADTGLLSQAFVNFLLNALDAMDEEGTLTVMTSPESPGWQLSRNLDTTTGPYVRLTIQDTGSGIPQDMVDRIFDPFFTTKSHGTGLGLSVAHGIIQDHLGLVECTSHPGQGTAFHIYFPLAEQEATA